MAYEFELRRYQFLLKSHLKAGGDAWDIHKATAELSNAPLVWWQVKSRMECNGVKLKQYALMGCEVEENSNQDSELQHNSDDGEGGDTAYSCDDDEEHDATESDDSDESDSTISIDEDDTTEPVLLNTNAPWSAFLCGLQGSGKSHALSCILEGCLMTDRKIGKNPNPLAGIVFHYDPLNGNRVCEAAYLCSSIETRVLVSASNYQKLKHSYEEMAKGCGGRIQVQVLDLDSSQLNTERMKMLMAIGKESEQPLYMSVVVNILREMAIQSGGSGTFNYRDFTARIAKAGLTDGQLAPLKIRLDLLESYVDLPPRPTVSKNKKSQITLKEKQHTPRRGADQADFLLGKPGTLTIVDLTDPIIDADAACLMFDICLSIFISQTPCGTIIALDEAHKYMGGQTAAEAHFTERLLTTIREQRHQGARVVIATQEPSVDPRLLDLCNVAMVHRCNSPAWYAVLRQHLAALQGKKEEGEEVLEMIVKLRVGECLLFCPTAAVGVKKGVGEVVMLGAGFRKFRTRRRVTADGGGSCMAVPEGV
ncbi:p-loop containing nucleoside triphosphate hydrolase [Pyrenophora seminiperda CCB06]|uniref:p-loop containing nucleoside triphosphate hydrolase n=1 Tax=Pyrenophora seminiperda CCB06 TaxID=1302712 RepID=A0A3M7M843_9PLEO|nr:p-loop containing nucleoside triphosphate hydrolase [Pyrenophora seminiperda CCB06]